MNLLVFINFASCISAASIAASMAVDSQNLDINNSTDVVSNASNVTVLPDDVLEAVRQQVLLDFSGATGGYINGKHINLPHSHIEVETLHTMMQQQSARQNALMSVQQKIMSAQEKQESLNRRFRSGQYTEEFLLDYAEGSGPLTKQVVTDVSQTMSPYTSMLKHAVGNFLLAPYLSSVTEGSRLYNQALQQTKARDTETKSTAHDMTTHYDELAHLGMTASLNYADLQSYTQAIIKELKL